MGLRKLKLWAAAEVYRPASRAMLRCRSAIIPYLKSAFEMSSLERLACEIYYVPIIMPEDMRERYPARSKLRKKEQIYDCAPQLDYEVFVSGTFEDQLREYVRGIAESGPHLAGLGATPEQIKDFERIMATAVERILVERPDQTRH